MVESRKPERVRNRDRPDCPPSCTEKPGISMQGEHMSGEAMELGAFSTSLAITDLATSREFYERLGFDRAGGGREQYLTMVNGLTDGAGTLPADGREEHPHLQSRTGSGHRATRRLHRHSRPQGPAGRCRDRDHGPEGTGSASITFLDPDGNPVLIDESFPKPGSSENSWQHDSSASQPLSRLPLNDGSPRMSPGS